MFHHKIDFPYQDVKYNSFRLHCECLSYFLNKILKVVSGDLIISFESLI